MHCELRLLGVTATDLAEVQQAPSLAVARERLNALKERARQQYHRLALELHPDRTGGDEAKAERFRAVTEVYERLMEVQPTPRCPRPLATYHGSTIAFTASPA